MWTEESHSAGVADKARSHEDAAHEKRNWVRLTFDCNDHCVFCLDADAHDGTVRSPDDVKRQILDGRRAGATRLILSGGEPTIHPQYVDFVRLGRLAGYAKIQTVTNGRMFAYADFLARCLDAGLSEITFSLHGPNARIHDALVGTKGAFEEEMRGLRGALARRDASSSGLPVVNVDVVVNRANVRHVPEMMRMLLELGVREFDLLQVVPFGRAFRDGRDTLFYDLAEARPHIQAALEMSRLPDVHVWMNRFPPQHLEGYEHLIQDPYKLNDEVRGRKEEFARWIDEGTPLDCREPSRCRYCYLEKLCDSLERSLAQVRERAFEIVRVDTAAEGHAPSSFGGDPATQKKQDRERRRLPLAGASERGQPAPAVTPEELVAGSRAHTLHVVAPDLPRALAAAARFPGLRRLELRLDDWTGLGDLLARGESHESHESHETGTVRREVTRVEARTSAQAAALLAMDASFEVVVDLTRETAPWLLSLGADSGAQGQPDPTARLALRQPTYERLTEAREHDVDLRDFFARFRARVPVEGVAACLLGRPPRVRPPVLDLAAAGPGGRLEIFRWTRRYIERGGPTDAIGYATRSLRCESCVHAPPSSCGGMHVNYVRAHGYAELSPVLAV